MLDRIAQSCSGVANSDLSNFPIAAGRNMQVLQIRSNLTVPEHYYIRVAGTPKDEPANFDTGGAGTSDAMQYRPRVLTPFLVPLHDEDKDWQTFSAWNQATKANDAEVIDTEPTKPLPSYGWTYRPEYQFSQFQLEIDSILREYTDESGQTHEQELLTEQLIDGKIPTIRSDDDLVSVFYSLVQQTVPRLTAIEGEQELVMSLGAHELKVTVTDTGEIRFDNLEQLDYLDPTDLLTIRLYLNHDAGNTLWEWAFTRNGLHVYYQVPGNTETRNGVVETDIEILSLLEPGETGSGVMPVQDPVVRTLGGMRLRYRYIPPSLAGTEITYVDWTINKRGRYCQGYGVDDPQGQCTVVDAGVVYKQTNIPPGDTADVYWEPLTDQPAPPMAGTTNVDWSNWAGTQTADAGVEASLKAHYTIPSSSGGNRVPRTYEQTFHIKTRELRPDPADPMEGSDVAMLEAMLWQLGISPQYGYPGVEGTRLGEPSNALLGAPVGGISGKAPRSIFSVGNTGANGAGSLEKMVCRFNYISYSALGQTSKCDMVDQGLFRPLQELSRHWVHYYQAYKHWQRKGNINYSDFEPNSAGQTIAEAGTALDAAVNVFDGLIAYPGGPSFTAIDPTYNATRHNAVQALTGTTFERSRILKGMAQKEGGGKHWTNYRIVVGGKDERGSKGFNQIYNAYTYGGKAQDSQETGNKAAAEVTAYTAAGASAVNHYDARQNLVGKVVWMAKSDTQGGGGSFYRAFVRTGNESYVGSYTAPAASPLRRIVTGSAAVNVTAPTHTDDDYERLAKGLGGYNQGVSTFLNIVSTSPRNLNPSTAWVDMLVNGVTGTRETAIRYALSIMHDADKMALPYRSYIWQGGLGVDINGDGVIQDVAADPTANPPVAGVVETTEPWCFAYGESEWINGTTWIHALDAAVGDPLAVPPVAPIGRINCVTGVVIP